MTGNRETLTDGDFYLSRCRVNRHVIELTGGESKQVRMNGKVSKVVIDATESQHALGSGNHGRFQLLMDIEDGGGTEIPYFDMIGKLNYTGAGSGQVALLEVSPGSNKGTATSKNSLHFSITTTSAAESGGVAIDEPAAWNGLVCGNVRILCDIDPTAAGVLIDPTAVIRVIILLE